MRQRPFNICRQGLLLLLLLLGSQSNHAAKMSETEAWHSWSGWLDSILAEELSPKQQLQRVNQHFNNYQWASDRQRWQQRDHWSSPLQTIASGAGDCEDLSIAKYASLLALGLDEGRLNLEYVFSHKLRQGHMVVTYLQADGSRLVLDSLNPGIHKFAERQDLQAVYRFNRQGVWLPKLGRYQAGHALLPSWQRILASDPTLAQDEQISTRLAAL
ncbi:MAG: transglutaminase-like cysteine peptidase [Cellvibrionaceae bacterium]|nr:transglutaminase-like cysteine peptidase [Cellvibrionaceae bacterium]